MSGQGGKGGGEKDPQEAAKKRQQEQEAMKKKQEEAQAQLDSILDSTRPKNFGQGLTSGLGNIVGGAVGAAGIIVLAPTVGLARGAQTGGIIGGTVGLVGGAVVGILGGAAMAVGGAVQGVTQVVRGVVAQPAAMIQPRKGKWWNETEGKWIETNLEKEEAELEKVPKDDKDILGDAEKEAAQSVTEPASGEGPKTVKDPFYYEVLGVDPSAEPAKIKRQYYVLARKYHPDRVGKDDKEAADKFKDIAEAYQVLSDDKLRKKYDEQGKEGLSPDRTEAASAMQAQLDPALLFAFLFGSDQFNDYIGRLAAATSAMVADSPKINRVDARRLQKRRCARLALSLAKRLEPWAAGDHAAAKAMWAAEAEELSKASYGSELVHLIGQVYTLAAVQFLGSLDSGIGMPSIGAWAKKTGAKMKKNSEKNKNQMETMRAGMDLMQLQAQAEKEMSAAKTDEEKKEIEEKLGKALGAGMLNVMWTTTVVDITNTLHETCQMVLFDKSVDKKVREQRGRGLRALGEIFEQCPKPGKVGDVDAQRLYEEAAFAAMLETIKRKEEASFNASIQH